MQVKTKLFSVLFAFALFFPCLFILTACGGNPGLKDNEITINVSNKVYDGQAIAVTATATSGETPTVVYKLAGADDSTYTTTAPKDAGNYVVSAGVAESSEYKAAVGTRNFSITAKEITLAWTAPANLAYDKTAKVATVQPSGIVQGDECNVQAAVTQGQNNVNAGSFTFTATLSGAAAANYALQNNGVSPQYTITPLDVTINWTAPANLVYNKQAKEPDVEITAGLLAGDLCDVQKALVAGHDNVNVGGFQFAATGLTNPNYKLPQNAVSPLYQITPMVLSDLHAQFVYSGQEVFEQELDMIDDGLVIQLIFDNSTVGADVYDYLFLMNGDVTENYDINNTCTADIVQKEVSLQWTAPTNLKFNNQAKVPTVAASNLVGSDVCNVTAALKDGDNNVDLYETFQFVATGLTGDDAFNYKLPDIAESPSYEVVIDSLTLDIAIDGYVARAGEAWVKLPVETAGIYEVKTNIGNLNTRSVYSYDGSNFTDITLGSRYVSPYGYICFEAEANTSYYLKFNLIEQAIGYILFRQHTTHEYSQWDDTCYCGAFDGTTLTVGTPITNLSGDVGDTLKFRFYARDSHFYYMTQSNLGANMNDYYIQFGSQGEQSFDQTFGFGEGNMAQADWDDWVYVYYTAPAAFANATLTICESVDAYGFHNTTYVGQTFNPNQEITIPNLANGEKFFFRVEVTDGVEYSCIKSSNIALSEIAIWYKDSNDSDAWKQDQDIGYNGVFHEFTESPTDWYVYFVITSDGDTAGTITVESNQQA